LGIIGSTAVNAGFEAIDARQQALENWVAAELGVSKVRGVAASSDASFRRYFRYQHGGGSVIAMDAPPPQEDCRPFVAVAGLLGRAGVHVPAVLAQDLDNGFLLLSDLGAQTYLDVLTQGNADALFSDAIDALLRIQSTPCEQVLPHYDEALLRRELALFPEWYLGQHLGLAAESMPRVAMAQLFDQLVERALAQGQVLVHRDYMPRNLMLATPNPGVLDFQDAVYGPISYDPTCLFKDAFISWPAPQVAGYLHQYWQLARQRGLPVPASFDVFQTDCDWMGVQRHLKVMGIFARICYRDGKPRYLQDVPRFVRYLQEVAQRYPALASLREILSVVDRLEGASGS
jgi:aminoglycoside/choline kinase family phosphotransferase